MPILSAEPNVFPETLLDEAPRGCSDRSWYAVYTKARQEKALARELIQHRIPFYLPLVKKINVSRGRRRTSLAPLFGGYLFLFADESERVRCLATNRVSRVLQVEDADRFVFDLRQLRQLIAAGAPLTVESRLDEGRQVRVRRGAFAGLEGTVVKRRGETRLLVCINFLQKGASVEIDDFLLEPLD
ncbi:MAG: antitermination protein NusG [Pirellulaceae bacterium]|nr:antitermination protein NusG [Pirellulaceae bacterium]